MELGWTRSLAKTRVFVFILCLAVIFTRAWTRLFNPDLWAEDGVRFVREAYESGFSSLWIPVDGSYHTLQRLIAIAGERLFPIAWLPAFICLVCFVLFAAIASKISDEDFEWLIPSRGARVLLAILICGAPGLNEMMGNLCNLNWSLYLWLGLTGLREPRRPATKWEAAATAMIVASTGTFALLIPLFAWRTWKARAGRTWSAAMVLLLFAGAAGLALYKGDRPPPAQIDSIWTLPLIYYSHLVRFVGLLPWGGDFLTASLTRPHSRIWFSLISVPLLGGVAFWFYRHRTAERAQALFLFLGGTSLWVVLCCMARPAALRLFENEFDVSYALHRYSFPTYIASVIFWAALMRPDKISGSVWSRPNRRALVFLVFFALNLAFGRHRFGIHPYGPERYWAQAVQNWKPSVAPGECGTLQARVYPWPHLWTFPLHPPCPRL